MGLLPRLIISGLLILCGAVWACHYLWSVLFEDD